LAKTKIAFFCTACGHESPKWMGKCPSCGEWNTLVEELVQKSSGTKDLIDDLVHRDSGRKKTFPQLLQDIVPGQNSRSDTKDGELNRVLGGGLVSGSLVLIGGQPGIGKSTLLLQLAMRYGKTVLYVSGEESEEQIQMRAQRITGDGSQCFIYTETDLTEILSQALKMKPALIIIDSIQTVGNGNIESAPGSITQIRECTAQFQKFAKETNIPVVLIGHITKEGGLAGPKVLEHIVDVVLQFEGDQNNIYRVLRTTKNRFGSTDELAIYSMDAGGLREILNPSEMLISQSDEDLSGTAVACAVEGLRPLLLETQALVTPTVYGTPQRSATGYDARRLSMILAVLEKRCGLPFGSRDVFLNLVGGIKISDPAIDLAVVIALISSLQDISIGKNICFAAEIGLTGEIRGVPRIEQRVQEAARLGFDTMYISKYSPSIKVPGIHVKLISKLEDIFQEIFG